MKKQVFTLIVLLTCLLSQGPSSAAERTAPQPDSLVEDFVRRWNAHDASALGAMFAPDGDFIGIMGTLWKNPAEIVDVHAKLFAGRYDASQYRQDGAPTTSYLTRDIALVRWHWTISKVRDEHDREIDPYPGIFTWVLVRQSQDWKIRAAQNELTH